MYSDYIPDSLDMFEEYERDRNAATDYMRNKPDVKRWQILNQRKRG